MLSTHGRGASDVPWRRSANVRELDQLCRDEVNLVSWHRELPSGLDEQLVEWAGRFPAQFDDVVSMPRYELSAALCGLAEPARVWLNADIAILLARLAHLAEARRLRVSFGAVRRDQCRKFHVDYVRYRLVTTYAGPGTEWVPDDAVHRSPPIEGTGLVRVVLVASTVDGS